MSSDRYSRQTRLPLFGGEGQLVLAKARVLVIGVGGLGSIVAMYLAGSGVGKLGLMDDDIVELHNLHRQIFFTEQDIGSAKVEVLATRIAALNHTVETTVYKFHLHLGMADIFSDYDLVLDCVDHFDTKRLINQLAIQAEVPHIFASVSGVAGQLAYFSHKKATPCLQCIFPNSARSALIQNCDTSGVLGPVAGWVATAQADLALQALLTSVEAGRLWTLDGLSMTSRSFLSTHNNKCLCGESAPEDISAVSFVQPAQLISMLKANSNVVLCDTRTSEDFVRSPLLAGALHLPFDNLLAWPDINKDALFVLFCEGTTRSIYVAKYLMQVHQADVLVLNRPQQFFREWAALASPPLE